MSEYSCYSPATIAMLFWENLPLSEAKALKHKMRTLDQTIMDIIVKRHQLHQKLGKKGSDRVAKDLLGMLLSTKPGSQGLSFKELRDQIATIIFAGRGTSSASLAWCLLCLAQHQDVQDRLRAEVRLHVTRPDGQPWDGQNVERMQYLDCVVKETLRLFPAIPSVSRQAVRDETLGAYFIPAGTTVTLAVGAMMRRPDLWAEPEQFKPERFLDSNTPKPYTWIPFLQGSRKCIGYKLAIMQIKITLAMLVRDLKFSVIPSTSYKRKTHGISMSPVPDLKLRVEYLSA